MTDDHDKILCERLATSIDHGICKCAERSLIAAIGRELDYARNELADERKRREDAEALLRGVRTSTIDQLDFEIAPLIDAHFARYKN